MFFVLSGFLSRGILLRMFRAGVRPILLIFSQNLIPFSYLFFESQVLVFPDGL